MPTSTILLRTYRPDDVTLLYEAVMESRASLGVWMPWCHAAYAIEDSQNWVNSQLEVKVENGVSFVISDDTGAFLGSCGINAVDMVNLRANFGYWVRSAATRRGVASEAARQCATWVFANSNLCRLEIVAALENIASQRVAEKISARREGVLRKRLVLNGRSHDAVVYSLVRDLGQERASP